MCERAAAPPRPAIPESLWALVVCLGVERTVLLAAPDARALAAALIGTAVAALLLGCALRLLGAGRAVPLVAVLGAAAVASAACAGHELARQEALSGALGRTLVSSWELELAGDMSEGASGWRGRARASRAGGPSGEVWLLADEPLPMGARVSCVGRFEPNGEDDWGASSRAQGLAGTVRAVRVLSADSPTGAAGAVLGLRERVLGSVDAASSDARALLAGSVCGYVGALSERGIDDAFATCGASHLVAVSGGHLVLVSALAGSLLGRTRLGHASRGVVLLACTALFVAFCGAPVSALRSWAMSLVAALSELVGRRSHPLSSASVVALGMALVDPGVTGQLGYLLSVTCVCGICAFGGYARHLVATVLGVPRLPRALPERVRAAVRGLLGDSEEALALTLVSQAVTLPLTASVFSQLSLVAPLANVLLAPLFSAFLAVGVVACALFWAPPLQALALACSDAVAGAILWVVGALSRLPLASVAVSVDEGPALALLALGCAALLVWWPSVSRRAVLGAAAAACACGLAWVVRWQVLAPARVVVLDVGQGDAILVTDGAASVLVDTGPDSSVVSALARSHVFALDAVVLTHLHADHAGGLDDVLETVPVGGLLVPEGTDRAELPEGPSVCEVSYGEALRVGRFTLRAVSPVEPAGGEGNEGSLELLLEYDDGGRSLTALLAADAEEEETGAAVERGDVGDVDLLKVGHHGSAASVGPRTAAALSPEVSVASAGEGNGYGHPTAECVETLEEAGSRFLCTKDVGDVTVEPGEAGPVVTCQRAEG